MDEGKEYVCDSCGATVRIGDFPFCRGVAANHGDWTGAEQPCEPFFCEHVSEDGETFTSKRAWARYLDKHNQQPAEYRSERAQHIVARGSTGQSLFFDMGGKR
jgi:hypothetical protein